VEERDSRSGDVEERDNISSDSEVKKYSASGADDNFNTSTLIYWCFSLFYLTYS
jgi:hypothetical protein